MVFYPIFILYRPFLGYIFPPPTPMKQKWNRPSPGRPWVWAAGGRPPPTRIYLLGLRHRGRPKLGRARTWVAGRGSARGGRPSSPTECPVKTRPRLVAALGGVQGRPRAQHAALSPWPCWPGVGRNVLDPPNDPPRARRQNELFGPSDDAQPIARFKGLAGAAEEEWKTRFPAFG